MKMKVIPGFSSLFGKSLKSYDEILKDVPTDIVVRVLISLNAELNTNEEHSKKQERLRTLLSWRYNKHQLNILETAFAKYKNLAKDYDGTLFARRYLLQMILKDLERNSKCIMGENEPLHEFNLLLSYLITIDEVHEANRELENDLKQNQHDEIGQLKLIWKGMLNQYDFNESANGAFELYKLICFFKYIRNKFSPYLKELLNNQGFKSISEMLSSFSLLMKATTIVDETQALKKLYYIEPNKNYDYEHLRSLSINDQLGKKNLRFSDIKKYPLYKTDDRGFMIIDEGMLVKKIYKGPLFETFYSTSLKTDMENRFNNPNQAFGNYKTDVSKEAIEKLCFRGIIKTAELNKHETLHFDEKLDSLPDMYFRSGKKILLIEFKDNLFSDNITENNDVDSLVKFIEERFIQNKSDSKKGIKQLINNVNLLYEGHFSFDPGLQKLLDSNSKLDISCMICYTEFIVGMPGINEYLNLRYEEEVNKNILNKSISNLTLVSLETLFHYINGGGTLKELKLLADRYWHIIENRRINFKKNPNPNTFLLSKSSFDEIYESIYFKEVKENKRKHKISDMLTKVGITDEFLSEIL